MIDIKTQAEIKIMRRGGKILELILAELREMIRPGILKIDLEKKAKQLLDKNKVKPTFLGFRGYPAVSCVSINDEIVHGIPNETKFKDGDLVSVDLGLRYEGLCLDAAFTKIVGEGDAQNKKLLVVTQNALKIAIENTRSEVNLGDVQEAIQFEIEKGGFNAVRDLAGHGIGRELQEEPIILNFGKKGSGPILKEGMTLAYEPMVAMGKGNIKVLSDRWTIVTLDGSLNAHFEDTVLVGRDKSESLTGQYKIKL